MGAFFDVVEVDGAGRTRVWIVLLTANGEQVELWAHADRAMAMEAMERGQYLVYLDTRR